MTACGAIAGIIAHASLPALNFTVSSLLPYKELESSRRAERDQPDWSLTLTIDESENVPARVVSQSVVKRVPMSACLLILCWCPGVHRTSAGLPWRCIASCVVLNIGELA